jgi:hypothetical protein
VTKWLPLRFTKGTWNQRARTGLSLEMFRTLPECSQMAKQFLHRSVGSRVSHLIMLIEMRSLVRIIQTRGDFGLAVQQTTLNPATPFKQYERHERTEQDKSEAEGITPLPSQFGHELEVHAVDAGDNGRRNTNH